MQDSDGTWVVIDLVARRQRLFSSAVRWTRFADHNRRASLPYSGWLKEIICLYGSPLTRAGLSSLCCEDCRC